MKISVLTLQNISNYGSVLQAFATKLFFESMGYRTEFVDYWRENMIDRNIAHELILHKNLKLKNVWGKTALTRNIAERLLTNQIEKQAAPFRSFVSEKLSVSSTRYTSVEQLNSDPPEADVYCVGSDQVWNSEWNGGFDKCFCLSYAKSGKPKLAFSSSFGVDRLPEDEGKKVKALLSDFDAVTVREESAVSLLKGLGIKSECILDPTLLVSREVWLEQTDAKIAEKQPYILVYQLNRSAEFDAIVNSAAEKYGKRVVRIEYRESDSEGEHIILPSVTEWISYFRYADYVITDSFHGTAFSLLFQRQFVDFLPDKYSGRINSILRLLGLEERRIETPDGVAVLEKEIDYGRVAAALEREAEKAKNIFSKVMKKYE